MPHGPRFIVFTSPGGRSSPWLRLWLIVTAIVAGVIVVWLGLVLALAIVLAGVLVLVPAMIWRSLRSSRNRSSAPVTIDGEYSITRSATDEDIGAAWQDDSIDEARDRPPR